MCCCTLYAPLMPLHLQWTCHHGHFRLFIHPARYPDSSPTKAVLVFNMWCLWRDFFHSWLVKISRLMSSNLISVISEQTFVQSSTRPCWTLVCLENIDYSHQVCTDVDDDDQSALTNISENQFLKFHVSCNRLRQKSGFSSINYHARDALDVGVHDIWCWYVDSRKSCVVWGVRLTAWYVNSSTLRWTWTHCSAVLTSLKPTVSWVSQVLMLSGKQSSILAAVWRCNLLPVVLRRHGHGYRDKVIHSSLTARWLCDL